MQTVRDFWCRSFGEASVLLGGRRSRKVCHNTVLKHQSEPDRIGLFLHGEEIASFFSDGRVKLFSRGWRTNTTKNRLNKVLPNRWILYQGKNHWWLYNHDTNETVPFVEGWVIWSDGRPTD